MKRMSVEKKRQRSSYGKRWREMGSDGLKSTYGRSGKARPMKIWQEDVEQPQLHKSECRTEMAQSKGLLSLLNSYELRIQSLKTYLDSSASIDRSEIVAIFGFEYPCCQGQSKQSRILLKELTRGVQELISENHRLKCLPFNQCAHEERGQERREQRPFLDSQNQELRRQNGRLRAQLVQQSLSSSDRQRNENGTQFYSEEDMVFAKKQLTKQMFEFSQQVDLKNRENVERVATMQERLLSVDRRLLTYEKERQMKVNSTIRKSYELTSALMRPIGDTADPLPEESDGERRERVF